MPAKSEKQRIAMLIALKHPEKLLSRNKSMLKMSKSQLSDYIHEPVEKKPKKRPSVVYGE